MADKENRPQQHFGRELKFTRRDTFKVAGGGLVLAAAGFGTQAVAAPTRGGTLRLGSATGSTTSSLDPVTFTNMMDALVGLTLGNALVEKGSGNELIPELAESWESSNGAKSWVFKIRQGVTFHSGKTLTATDVIYSINRHRGDDSKSAVRSLFANVASITAPDEATVMIELNSGDADLPYLLGAYQLIIVPEGYAGGLELDATGAYQLVEYEPGVRFRATRNPNYWKADRGWFDDVEITVLSDSTARVNALLSGEVDGVDRYDSKLVSRAQAAAGLTVIETAGARYQTSVMDTRAAPFDDNHVRMAVKYAVKRQELIDKVLSGFGELGNDHPVPSSDPFFNTELPQREFDPDKSKWHLKQAGQEGLKIELHASEAPFRGGVDAAILMQASFAEAGIDLAISKEPKDGYWGKIWMKKPFVLSNWGMRPTPVIMMQTAIACGAKWGEAFWCDDRFTARLAEARVETDFEKRKELIWELQELIHNNGGNNIFAMPSNIDVYNTQIGGLRPDNVRSFLGGRIAERAWRE